MHLQGADTHPLLQAGAAAAQQGATAGGQFLKAEGLAQHVVGTGIEQGHHRLGARAGREHHHRAAQLGRQTQGRALIQQLSADQEIGRLVVADLESFTGGGHSGRQVAILAKSLGQNRSQGCVRIHHQNPLGLTSGLGWGQAG